MIGKIQSNFIMFYTCIRLNQITILKEVFCIEMCAFVYLLKSGLSVFWEGLVIAAGVLLERGSQAHTGALTSGPQAGPGALAARSVLARAPARGLQRLAQAASRARQRGVGLRQTLPRGTLAAQGAVTRGALLHSRADLVVQRVHIQVGVTLACDIAL